VDEHQGRDPIFGQSETVAELLDRTFDLLRSGRVLAGRRLERRILDGQLGCTRYRRCAAVSHAAITLIVFLDVLKPFFWSRRSYPENNCGINGKVTNPQDIFASYLTHNSAVGLVGPYIDGTTQVLAAGKDIMMMEFGTASCGGFPGLSDSFGAALW
jgi:hypothetical protein